jgi:uncharacterized membrane protein YfcA
MMAIWFGYIGALFIGLVLGLTGGGGSILTVPILVYIMNFNPVTAAAYSLFIVGTTSAFGTLQNFRKGIVEVRTAFIFAIPSFTAVFITRKFIVPAIPNTIFENQSLVLTKNTFLMVLFAVVMFAAALSMLRKKTQENAAIQKENVFLSIIKIIFVGFLIGLIGAGGGFLIIPALVFMAKLPMRKAIATSLLVISLNSLIGFAGDVSNFSIDWQFLAIFTFIAIVGIYVGIYLSKFSNENQLKKGFGWFVLVMAVFILVKELFLAPAVPKP